MGVCLDLMPKPERMSLQVLAVHVAWDHQETHGWKGYYEE